MVSSSVPSGKASIEHSSKSKVVKIQVRQSRKKVREVPSRALGDSDEVIFIKLAEEGLRISAPMLPSGGLALQDFLEIKFLPISKGILKAAKESVSHLESLAEARGVITSGPFSTICIV